jgi:Domain of unknown function (DUF4335)
MNSSNLHSRQFVQNTCELSIEDKKSPFPAWMKFNKPNPLRFSLNLQDPDRPELEPVQVTGDRAKLETLQGTVDSYVKEIVAQAPMATMGEDASKLPSKASADDRPIDALNVTDNQPRLEADGPSRHLFYLGNSADANAAVLSLSTLQLFDLSSVLNEAVAPATVAVPEDSSAFLTALTGSPLVENASGINTNTTGKDSAIQTNEASLLSNNLEEPRVVLPSINDPKEPVTDEFYSLETESSILERGGANRNQFKNKSNNLNLPELPDFSQSPLTSIPLWIGLGTMAAGIIAFPFISSYFKNNSQVATKPGVPIVSTSPSTSSEEPTPYQPSSASVPGSVVPSVNVGSAGNTGLPTTVVPSPALGDTTLFANNGGQGGRQTTTQRTDSTARQGTPANNGGAAKTGNNDRTNRTASQSPSPANSGSQPRGMRRASDVNKPSDSQVATNNQGKTGAAGNRRSADSSNVPLTNDDDVFNRLPNGGTETSGVPGTSGNTRSRKGQKTTTPAADSGFGTVNGDLAGTEPVSRTTVPTDNSQPVQSQPLSNDSVQVKGVQSYFQQRWKADPAAQESLQYRIKVGQNGQVQSIEGQGNYSQRYLDKTKFLKPGDQVSTSGKKDQSVWLILRQDGEVQALQED